MTGIEKQLQVIHWKIDYMIEINITLFGGLLSEEQIDKAKEIFEEKQAKLNKDIEHLMEES